MNFYKFDILKHQKETYNLTIYQEIAYRRLMDVYAYTESPILGTVEHIAEIIRMKNYVEDVEFVLRRFFLFLSDIGWRHVCLDTQIDRSRSTSKKRALAKKQYWEHKLASNSYKEIEKNNTEEDVFVLTSDEDLCIRERARNSYNYNINNNNNFLVVHNRKGGMEENQNYDTPTKLVSGVCFCEKQEDSNFCDNDRDNKTFFEPEIYTDSTIVEQLYNNCTSLLEQEYHIDRNTESKKLTQHRPCNKENRIARKPDDVDEELWLDYKALRNRKKAPITESVIKRLRSEADKSGFTMNEAISEMCHRGWTGFKAEWVSKKNISFNSREVSLHVIGGVLDI